MAGKRWIGMAALLMACGGGAEGMNEPETPESVDTGEPESASEPASEPAAESPDVPAAEDTEAPAPAAATLDEAALKEILQAVLDDPDLGKYLHLDKPGRLPVKIAGSDLPKKLDLHKGGRAVEIVEEPAKGKAAVLVFTRIELDGNLARVRYRYDIEGVRGSASVALKDGAWLLTSNRVIER